VHPPTLTGSLVALSREARSLATQLEFLHDVRALLLGDLVQVATLVVHDSLTTLAGGVLGPGAF